MKSVKGFTLIELLAVIIILAIIALILTPMITNVIENSRKASVADSAYGIVSAANVYFSQNMGTDKVIGIIDLKSDTIEYNGSIDSGTLSFNTDGDVQLIISKGIYCAYKPFGTNVTSVGTYSNGECDINGTIIQLSDITTKQQALMINLKQKADNSFLSESCTDKEIDVITTDSYSNYIISTFAPSDLTKLWLSTTTNEETLLDLDTINISLGYVYQYKDNKWESKDAYICKSGAWIKLSEGIDDWMILAKNVGINPSNYSSIDDFFNDKNAMNIVMNSEAGVNYLINSISKGTNVIEKATLSSTQAITSMSTSKYAMLAIANNSTWFSDLKASNDYSSTYVPILLSSTVLSNSEKYSYGYPVYVFNNGTVNSQLLTPTAGYKYVYVNGGTMSHNASTGSVINIALSSTFSDCAEVTYGSSTVIDYSKYLKIATNVSSIALSASIPNLDYGLTNTAPSNPDASLISSAGSFKLQGINYAIINGSKSGYLLYKISACSGGGQYTSSVNISQIWI